MDINKIVELVQERLQGIEKKEIPIEASGRHIHLSKEDSEKLFGTGYTFNKIKDLSQPGQYACKERVRLVGPKGVIEGVIILGPFRGETQVELSLTDARVLGIDGILRMSGDIDNTPGLIVTNGDKAVTLEKGVIVAKNHIHMTDEDAKKLNVQNGELVKVKVHSKRPVIFEDVIVRVNKDFSLAMHIDYDEANACLLDKNSYGELYE